MNRPETDPTSVRVFCRIANTDETSLQRHQSNLVAQLPSRKINLAYLSVWCSFRQLIPEDLQSTLYITCDRAHNVLVAVRTCIPEAQVSSKAWITYYSL